MRASHSTASRVCIAVVLASSSDGTTDSATSSPRTSRVSRNTLPSDRSRRRNILELSVRLFFGHYTMNLRHSPILRFWRHAGVICSVAACSQVPPRTYPSPEPATISASFERTWSAVIDHFAEKSVPIRTIEKASGIIVAEQLSVSSGYGQVIADCGMTAVGIPWDVLSASYNVRVQGDTVRSTIRVTAMFRPEIASTYPCNSRGNYERELMDFVKARAEKR